MFIIRNKSQLALQRLQQQAIGDVVISTITLAELRYGADKSQDPTKNQGALNGFLAPLEVVDFDAQAAGNYSTIRADLDNRGLVIGPLDMLIAAHAHSLGAPLDSDSIYPDLGHPLEGARYASEQRVAEWD